MKFMKWVKWNIGEYVKAVLVIKTINQKIENIETGELLVVSPVIGIPI